MGEEVFLWPVWAIVVSCGVVSQVIKLAIYSVMKRHFDLALVAQGRGLPSLPATSLTCLLVLVVMRSSWDSSQAAFAFVFAVIVIHDTVKLRIASTRQREVLFHLVTSMPDKGQIHQRVADYLDPRSHQVSHVAVGMVFGALFGLAFGSQPG